MIYYNNYNTYFRIAMFGQGGMFSFGQSNPYKNNNDPENNN